MRARASGSVRPLCFSGSGRRDFAESIHEVAETDSSPLRLVITSPVMDTKSPMSTMCFHWVSAASPTSARDSITCRSPDPSRSVAKQSLPPSRLSITRPTTLTVVPVRVSAARSGNCARTSASVVS